MDDVEKGFMNIKSKYDKVLHDIQYSNSTIQNLQNELVQLREQQKRLRSYVDPHITINEIKI